MKSIKTLVVLGGFLVIFYQISAHYQAERYHYLAKKALSKGLTELAYTTEVYALKKNSQEQEYYRNLALILAAQGKKAEALAALERGFQLNPQNLAFSRDSLQIYYFLAHKDINSATSVENRDAKYVEVAQKYYTDMATKYAADAGTLVDVAKYQKMLDLDEDFEKSKEMIEKLRPDVLQWHPDLL